MIFKAQMSRTITLDRHDILLSGDENPLPGLLRLLAGARGTTQTLRDPAIGAWGLFVAANLARVD